MEINKKFLIDSDMLIDFLRGVKEAKDFLLKLEKKGKLIISTINVMEIYSGKDIKNPAKKKIINDFLNDFKIIQLNEDIAKKAGEIRLESQTPFADAIIAATAIYVDAILVTKNIKHFSRIENLEIQSL